MQSGSHIARSPAPENEPAVQADETVTSLIDSANAHFEAAETAQRAGDWATYGRELDALKADLERLSQLIEE